MPDANVLAFWSVVVSAVITAVVKLAEIIQNRKDKKESTDANLRQATYADAMAIRDELRKEIARLTERVKTVEDERNELNTSIAAMGADLAALRVELADTVKERDCLARDLQDAVAKTTALEKERKALREKLDAYECAQGALNRRIHELEKQVLELSGKVEQKGDSK